MEMARILYTEAFENNPTRTPRSDAYKTGVLDALRFRESGNKATVKNPYILGTADADAWFSGINEGYSRWKSHIEKKGAYA